MALSSASEQREIQALSFDRSEEGYIYYRYRWSRGVPVSVDERDEYLRISAFGLKKAWHRSLAGRTTLPPRHYNSAMTKLLAVIPRRVAVLGLICGVASLVRGFNGQHTPLASAFLLGGGAVWVFGSSIVLTHLARSRRCTSERAINRALMDVALRWGVDPQRAHHNPVFWRDGALNYYEPISHRQEVFRYLKNRGILGKGHNGAFKLNCGFNELDKAADVDLNWGIDLDVVVGLLVSQLVYQHGELWLFCPELGRHVIVRSERISEILKHLCVLGFVELVAEPKATPSYQWAPKALPILKAHYLWPVSG